MIVSCDFLELWRKCQVRCC